MASPGRAHGEDQEKGFWIETAMSPDERRMEGLRRCLYSTGPSAGITFIRTQDKVKWKAGQILGTESKDLDEALDHMADYMGIEKAEVKNDSATAE